VVDDLPEGRGARAAGVVDGRRGECSHEHSSARHCPCATAGD
jgi:hypothetical protein